MRQPTKFRTAREERDEFEFYSTVDQTNPLPWKQGREAGAKLPPIATNDAGIERATFSGAGA